MSTRCYDTDLNDAAWHGRNQENRETFLNELVELLIDLAAIRLMLKRLAPR
jgi:hypothetical protein